MKKLKIAIIGAGNISNTRHIPALKKNKNVEIYGVISNNQKNIIKTTNKHKIKNYLLLSDNEKDIFKEMSNCKWFKETNAVVIGAPPQKHFCLAKAALKNNKHVLIEKPMTMNINESNELIILAKEKNKNLCVMHNFQFSSGIKKLEEMINKNKLGEIVSICETQFTNRNRRLPDWYNELPLGLFYDEAPHFIYLLEKFGGEIKIKNVYIEESKDTHENTPIFINISLVTKQYPANIFINFNSPICEWLFIVCCTKKIGIYDLFKDILVILPTDKEHYAVDILKNSFSYTFQYWWGFIKNGFKMIGGNLLYGHDILISKFVSAILEDKIISNNFSGVQGQNNIRCLNDIIIKAKEKQENTK